VEVKDMKVLVTGGAGLLGYWVVNTLKSRGFEVYATHHEKKPPQTNVRWVRLDLEDLEGIGNIIKEVKPDVIIHSAAYTDVDGCEVNKEKAFRVNYLGTEALAKVSSDVELFIYVSTDYVFDGEKGLYNEDDIPAPINYYGLTKLLGEVVVRNLLPRNSCIVRVSGLYGFSPTGKRNFGLLVLEKLMNREVVEAFTNQWLSPTYVKFLAEALVKLVEGRLTGTLHIAGERLSRYEFATLLADVLGVEKSLVKPKPIETAKLIARRPKDSSLNTLKAKGLGLIIPPITECLRDMVLTYRELSGGVR
jgi:dTDP-4-dehydrorhamnose reductase